MTRLPSDDRNAIDRPDLPEYPLNDRCPVTGEAWNLEAHHLFRRSAGYPSWWVELSNGDVIGNRINLSSKAHERITTNRARIVYDEGVWYWEEAGEREPLQWQPPTNPESQTVAQFSGGLATPQEGESCALCKRRVPHKKKASSPKTKVASIRIPVDDAETFEELIDAAAEHMGAKEKPHHKWATLVTGLALILQTPREQLP